MAKRIIGALFIIIVFSVIGTLFMSFAMAPAPDGHAVELSDWWCNDEGLDPPDFNEGEDFASCSGDLQDTDDDSLNDHFQFTIHDGYPGYECTFNLTVHNAGNETLWINEISVTSNHPHVSVNGVSVSPTSELAPDDESAGGDDEAVVVFTVTVLPDATQGTTYDDVITGSIKVDDEEL